MFIAGIGAVEGFILFGLLAYALVLIIIFVPAFLYAWVTGQLKDYE